MYYDELLRHFKSIGMTPIQAETLALQELRVSLRKQAGGRHSPWHIRKTWWNGHYAVWQLDQWLATFKHYSDAVAFTDNLGHQQEEHSDEQQ